MLSTIRQHKYESLARNHGEQAWGQRRSVRVTRLRNLYVAIIAVASLFVVIILFVLSKRYINSPIQVRTATDICSSLATKVPVSVSCDTTELGYVCSPEISQYWGQYSPYFSVPIPGTNKIPKQCKVTFAQILSRHGAQNPTAPKSAAYSALVSRLKNTVKSFSGEYSFIAEYNYTLGADRLTTFGQHEMIHSGIKFFQRYSRLGLKVTPFIRSSSEDLVVESAKNFSQGFHQAWLRHNGRAIKPYPYGIMVISEDKGSNNTLSHGLCTSFEYGVESKAAGTAQNTWTKIHFPAIQSRLNRDLPGADLSISDVISLMDMCPFHTIASPLGTLSPFCKLFSESEWRTYDYHLSLGKYYGYGDGNSMGPTQGVGFVNELIARLTSKPVKDSTSTNRTLNSNPATFPVGGDNVLFADFSHDDDMIAIFSALGLYSTTNPLTITTIKTIAETAGLSASWTVPFAARAYFEKLSCTGESEELVRVIVNDRVLPLEMCGGNALGACKLSAFVKSMSFAQQGGHWAQCFD
jgi:hypothetical protein